MENVYYDYVIEKVDFEQNSVYSFNPCDNEEIKDPTQLCLNGKAIIYGVEIKHNQFKKVENECSFSYIPAYDKLTIYGLPSHYFRGDKEEAEDILKENFKVNFLHFRRA